MNPNKRKALISKKSRSWAPPVVLTVAGSDSSGGAGIQADLKTFTTLGVYGTSAITCVVAEHPGRVARIDPLPATSVRKQIDLAFEAFPVRAVKTGMLYSEELIRATAAGLRRNKAPLVIDPVMVASSGDRLLKPDARHALCEKLLPLATVLTPNRNEAALLLGWPVRDLLNAASLCEAGWVLAKKFGVAVLVKGGNLGGVEALDFLCTAKSVRIFRAPWFKGIDPHGTGCTYSAAIAAGLAKGHALETAVGLAKQFITRAIFSHFRLGKYLVLNQLPK